MISFIKKSERGQTCSLALFNTKNNFLHYLDLSFPHYFIYCVRLKIITLEELESILFSDLCLKMFEADGIKWWSENLKLHRNNRLLKKKKEKQKTKNCLIDQTLMGITKLFLKEFWFKRSWWAFCLEIQPFLWTHIYSVIDTQ